MFGECHAHLFMDGIDYRAAKARHFAGVDEENLRLQLREYQKRGITFVRDGGDACNVSRRAKELAEEYGIDYRSPIFAIHLEHRYGSIVGFPFSNMKEYHARVLQAKKAGADFIKIMTTGILDFHHFGVITGTPLREETVREMVHIAHEEGFAVMSHTNGIQGVQAALAAGVDSLEHGNYMDDETIRMLSRSGTVWVPTVSTVYNLLGDGRFPEEEVQKIAAHVAANVRRAYELGACVAPGSDAGAYRVLHGQGIMDEVETIAGILGDRPETERWLKAGENRIQERFKRRG
ncbi:MAG: Xaa-Pro dipeptidase [Blautia sp.]|nr:Xaa-Pro dipeptidase [Blautia sp.]